MTLPRQISYYTGRYPRTALLGLALAVNTPFETSGPEQENCYAKAHALTHVVESDLGVMILPHSVWLCSIDTAKNVGQVGGRVLGLVFGGTDEQSEPSPPTTELPTEIHIDTALDARIDNVPEIKGVDAELIQSVLRYLTSTHGLSAEGAAYYVGNALQESGLNPLAEGDFVDGKPTAFGIAQWRFGRTEGLPHPRFMDLPSDITIDQMRRMQIDFSLLEMVRDGRAADLPLLLRQSGVPPGVYEKKFEDWERWGHEGKRFLYAEQIKAIIN